MEHSQPGLGHYLGRSWRGGRATSLGHLMIDDKPLGAVLLPSLKNLVPCISWAVLGLGTGVCHGGGRVQVGFEGSLQDSGYFCLLASSSLDPRPWTLSTR